jgi:hypothetical protein
MSIIDTGEKNIFDLSMSGIKELIAYFPYPASSNEKQHVVFIHDNYTIVPEALYVAEKKEQLYEMVLPMDKFHGVYAIQSGSQIILYALNDMFVQSIKHIFPGINLHHHTTFLIQSYTQMIDKNKKDRLYVNLHANFLEIFYYNKQQFVFHNHFPFESDTDIIYFLLSVSETLEIPSDKLEVIISGQFSNQSPLIGLMKKYIPQVFFMPRPDVYQYPVSFRELQDHQYFLQLTGPLCE